MKIMVVGVDGNIEVINLVGIVEAQEPGNELEYPRNQSPLHVKETGMDYFFREDGRYDGWGRAVNLGAEEATAFIDAIEKDREFPEDLNEIRKGLDDVANGRVRPLEEIEEHLDDEPPT